MVWIQRNSRMERRKTLLRGTKVKVSRKLPCDTYSQEWSTYLARVLLVDSRSLWETLQTSSTVHNGKISCFTVPIVI
jgi:hypothetical protein